MKKIVLTIALLGAVAYSYGQGTVAVGNSAALASVKADNGTMSVLPSSATPTVRFALFYAPTTSTAIQFDLNAVDLGAAWTATVNSLAGWTLASQGFNSATTAGRITFSPATQPIPGYASGASVALFMTSWQDTGTLATWDLARATLPGAMGSSAQVQVTLGGGVTPVPAFWGTGATQSGAITLVTIVPEPTSFALAGLGAAALLIFRRRS